jgi:hypothetical protein
MSEHSHVFAYLTIHFERFVPSECFLRLQIRLLLTQVVLRKQQPSLSPLELFIVISSRPDAKSFEPNSFCAACPCIPARVGQRAALFCCPLATHT